MMTPAADSSAIESRTGMLVRRPAAEVYAAFVDPRITTRFWFTHASGPLREGAQVEWRWAMHNVQTVAKVVALEADRRIEIDWSGDDGSTRVEWQFTPRADGSTFVEIRHYGFSGSPLEQAARARDSTEGFALVLAGLKALLEYGIDLHLVGDRFPSDA